MADLGTPQVDFIDRIRELSGRIRQLRAQGTPLATEEATKMALIVPFIGRVLGYDVYDPAEVVPEFTADVGLKKGEKVDYAIIKDGKPVILFECKQAGGVLNIEQAGQLFRYFSVTQARVGVLTDGIRYRIFSDLEKPNLMDEKPFVEFNLEDFDETLSDELKKFSKPAFDLETILATATELKYTREIRRLMSDEFANPSDEFVRFFARSVYAGSLTQGRLMQFRQLTQSAAQQFLADRINDRLKSALAVSQPQAESALTEHNVEPESAPPTVPADVVTTDEEREAYYAVKAILRDVVDPKRIALRDQKSFCSVLLDDNNRKPLCRFYFSPTRKAISIVVNAEKHEERFSIDGVDGLYEHADLLRKAVAFYTPSP